MEFEDFIEEVKTKDALKERLKKIAVKPKIKCFISKVDYKKKKRSVFINRIEFKEKNNYL